MEYKGVSGLNGSYKMSEAMINRILSREFTEEGKSSISNYEILALIHFSQICDIQGVIEEYKVLDLAGIIGCSRRACYNVLSNLESKGFISQTQSSWTGYRRIDLLDNDFSDADYKTTHYINTNYSYLNHFHPDYTYFKGLSLYAKKTLLVILLKYQNRYGYRVELDTLKEYLGVTKKSMVMGYIEELRAMFDDRIFVVSSNNKERIKNHNLYIHSKMPCFVAETSISEYQDCYTKFRIDILFRKKGIIFENINSANDMQDARIHGLQQLYSLFVHYISKGLTVEDIESAVVSCASSFGRFDELVLYNINQILTPLIKNAS